MFVNNPQSADRFYKFTYKTLGIKFHQYLYHEGMKIEFIETEIPNTGQKKDMVVKEGDKLIRITEFMATELNDDKLKNLSDYHQSSRNDPTYKEFKIKTEVVSIANPKHGKNQVKIDDNLLFCVNPIFTKKRDGWKSLSTIIYKIITQEELSDNEAIDLLILPDMNIKLPIKTLMSIIIYLIGHNNIPDKTFKNKIIHCEILFLARIFNDDELSEMIEMLQTKNPEVTRIIEKYGEGFDVIYFDGKTDGILETASNFLAKGFDEEIIAECTGISITKIKKLKREL